MAGRYMAPIHSPSGSSEYRLKSFTGHLTTSDSDFTNRRTHSVNHDLRPTPRWRRGTTVVQHLTLHRATQPNSLYKNCRRVSATNIFRVVSSMPKGNEHSNNGGVPAFDFSDALNSRLRHRIYAVRNKRHQLNCSLTLFLRNVPSHGSHNVSSARVISCR